MPATNIGTKWSSGKLVFFDKATGTSVAEVDGPNLAFDILSGSALKLAGTAVTATATELNTLDGATATAAEMNTLAGQPYDYTITPAAGAANVCEITVQAKDANGTNIAHAVPLLVWLSDSATGAGLTATAASGTVQAKAGSQDLGVLTAKKALMVQTSAAGAYVLEITDTAKTAFKVCVQSLNGELPTIATLITADYGA